MKESYVNAEIEIIEFETEDVITNSLPFVPFGLDANNNGVSDIDEGYEE